MSRKPETPKSESEEDPSRIPNQNPGMDPSQLPPGAKDPRDPNNPHNPNNPQYEEEKPDGVEEEGTEAPDGDPNEDPDEND